MKSKMWVRVPVGVDRYENVEYAAAPGATPPAHDLHRRDAAAAATVASPTPPRDAAVAAASPRRPPTVQWLRLSTA